MKTYIINNQTNEKVEVSICDLNGKKAWITIESKQIICDVDMLPHNLQVVYDTSEDKQMFGKWLTNAYRSQGWKKSKFCEATGITRKSILLIESGEGGVTFDTLVRICNVLGVEFKYPISAEYSEDSKSN